MDLDRLFQLHIKAIYTGTLQILEELSLKGLVLGSGSQQLYYGDDQEVPFRPNSHFAHWAPLNSPEHAVVIEPGKKPLLLFHYYDDFWHDNETLDECEWVNHFDVETFSSVAELWGRISKFSGFAFIGEQVVQAQSVGLVVDCEGLLPRLNWQRSYKTEYEVYCLEQATKIAAKGHLAARSAFEMGESELGIQHAYLVGARLREAALPYENIVCLNEKAAFLHYREKRDHIRNGHLLLIDAGAQFRGYASDITRTWLSESAPAELVEIYQAMQQEQARLASIPRPGMTMADLNWESHLSIAKILLDHGLLQDIGIEDAISEGLTADFYPHGVGHMLGLLVHDVAGRQVNPRGDLGKMDSRFPKLRSVRQLEAGHYFTIEPGLYFIKSLLDKRVGSPLSEHFNWTKIERLSPFGGIRIEDNVLIGKSSTRNITREYLAD